MTFAWPYSCSHCLLNSVGVKATSSSNLLEEAFYLILSIANGFSNVLSIMIVLGEVVCMGHEREWHLLCRGAYMMLATPQPVSVLSSKKHKSAPAQIIPMTAAMMPEKQAVTMPRILITCRAQLHHWLLATSSTLTLQNTPDIAR